MEVFLPCPCEGLKGSSGLKLPCPQASGDCQVDPCPFPAWPLILDETGSWVWALGPHHHRASCFFSHIQVSSFPSLM